MAFIQSDKIVAFRESEFFAENELNVSTIRPLEKVISYCARRRARDERGN